MEEITKKEWPDLDVLAKEIFDSSIDSSSELVHEGVKCSMTEVEVKGPLYHCRCLVNHEEIELNYSEETIHLEDSNSLNPLIFIRVSKKLKKDA